jgi:thymidylate synthase (FAD)
MNSIDSNYNILETEETPIGRLKHIERIARICYKSEDRITEDGESAKKMLKMLVNKNHEAMLEHVSYILGIKNLHIYQLITRKAENLKSHGYPIYLRYTSDIPPRDGDWRFIISGNARAWRDFLRAYIVEYNQVLPPYFFVFFTKEEDKEILFSEFKEYYVEFTNPDLDYTKLLSFITKDQLLTKREQLVHHDLSIKFTVDRGISHEFVRHRPASFAQESTRYCNYSIDKFCNNVSFIDLTQGMLLDLAMRDLPPKQLKAIKKEWQNACRDAEKHYMNMIKLGSTAQIARGVLPNSTKTELTITTNLAEWKHIVDLRAAKDAHPQMREVMVPLAADLKERFPEIF